MRCRCTGSAWWLGERGAQRHPGAVTARLDGPFRHVQQHGRLGQALAGLSPELRGAIEATVLDGLTCAEAAVLLGVAEGTVKSRCHRARVALRAALADPPSGPDTTAPRREAWGTS